MKKHRPLRRKGNVILFPGTYENVLNRAFDAFEQSKYAEAIEAFAQARAINPSEVSFLGPYAIALYEERRYEEADDVVRSLLEKSHRGMPHYIGMMELFVTINIQLKNYREVDEVIQRLFNERMIPLESMKKMEYLRDLNARLQTRYAPVSPDVPKIYDFLSWNEQQQLGYLTKIERGSLQEAIPLLQQIVKSTSIAPFIHTHAVILLQKAKHTAEVTVVKNGIERSIVPAHLPLPFDHIRVSKVREQLEIYFEKDPSVQFFVRSMVEKYSLYGHPFPWGDAPVNEVVEAYIQYIEHLTEQKEIDETALFEHIKEIDQMTEE